MKESKRIQKLKEKKVTHKLGIIVPYRDREQQLKRFLSHMKDYIKDIDYEIFIIEQADDKPFNRGKLLNAGYKYAVDKGCDYFVFHDVDMLPEDVDYSYSDKPLHLATHLQEHDYETTFFDYFGGVTMFTKEDFKTINGFSNEYWGWGFEDDDLLIRCLDSNLQLDMDSNGSDTIQEIESFKFDGNESFIKLSTDKKSWKKIDLKIVDTIVDGVAKVIYRSGEGTRLVQTGNLSSSLRLMIFGITVLLVLSIALGIAK